MRKLLLLVLLFPLLSFACEEQSHQPNSSPLWLKYLNKAAKKKQPHVSKKNISKIIRTTRPVDNKKADQ